MKSMKQEHGFTMIEALLSLLCAALVCTLLTQTAKLLIRSAVSDREAEDRLAVKQLQLILAQSNNLYIEQNQLHFTYHREAYYLTQYENKLVKRKGFEVILQNIDEVSFTKQESCFQMTTKRLNKIKRVVLACEE